jgi:hypothetical protein
MGDVSERICRKQPILIMSPQGAVFEQKVNIKMPARAEEGVVLLYNMSL